MFSQLGGRLFSTSGAVMPLSPAVEVGGIVYLSGSLPIRDGRLFGEDIETQAGVMLDNAEAILANEGLTLADVFKVTCWLVRRADFEGYNRVFAARFTDPYPARTTVISELALPDALIEAELTACRPGDLPDRRMPS